MARLQHSFGILEAATKRNYAPLGKKNYVQLGNDDYDVTDEEHGCAMVTVDEDFLGDSKYGSQQASSEKNDNSLKNTTMISSNHPNTNFCFSTVSISIPVPVSVSSIMMPIGGRWTDAFSLARMPVHCKSIIGKESKRINASVRSYNCRTLP